MGNWNGLIYNTGLALNDNLDWLEIERLNLPTPAQDLVVNNYTADPAPTQSFIRLLQGTSTSPTHSQCRNIEDVGVSNGALIVVIGNSAGTVQPIHSTGNLHLAAPAFGFTTYSTMVLACTGSQWYEIARSDNN